MGYISNNQIEAYLTQKGRALFLSGEKKDSIVKYFTLGDSDKNYFNQLNDFDVCDLSGDNDICIRSLSESVTVKYVLNQTPLLRPNLKFLTDSNLTSNTNDKEVITIAIGDNSPRNFSIKFNLNVNIISKSEWFNKIIYKGITYTNPNDVSSLQFEIIAGDLQTSPIEFYFNDIPFSQPFNLIQSLQMVLTLTNFNGAIMGLNDVINIVKTQGSYPTLALSTETTLVSCGAENDGKIIATASGGSNNYIFTLKDATRNIETNNATGIFEGLQVGNYVVTVTDNVGFTTDESIILSKVTDFTIANIQRTDYNDANGKIKVTLSNIEGLVQYRLFRLPENTLVTQSLMITDDNYEFNIPLGYLDTISNTPMLYTKEKEFRIEIYSQYCGVKTNSNGNFVRDITSIYAQDVIRCEQVNLANRTNNNRVYSQKDINSNSPTYLLNKVDINGNTEWLFYDTDVFVCPLPVSGTMSFKPEFFLVSPVFIGITYTNTNGNLVSLTENTIINNNLYLGNSGDITINLSHSTSVALSILEDGVNIYTNNITNLLTYTFTALPNKFYRISLAEF